jgi:hypothetical protein
VLMGHISSSGAAGAKQAEAHFAAKSPWFMPPGTLRRLSGVVCDRALRRRLRSVCRDHGLAPSTAQRALDLFESRDIGADRALFGRAVLRHGVGCSSCGGD